MAFQTVVPADIGFAIPGELTFEGPLRAQPCRLNTTVPANNVFGRAFTHVAGAANEGVVAAGGTGVFAGIMVNPKEHVSFGNTTDGTLGAQSNLRNGELATFLQMGQVAVMLPAAAAIGDEVCFVQADGTLVTVLPGVAAPGGATKIPNCVVERYAVTAAGLAFIRLTN